MPAVNANKTFPNENVRETLWEFFKSHICICIHIETSVVMLAILGARTRLHSRPGKKKGACQLSRQLLSAALQARRNIRETLLNIYKT